VGEQTIKSEDIKVAEVFNDFYVVPPYQREYVWKTEQVEQLLNDINTELAGSPPGQAPEYFIGSIVVCPGENGVLDLIDGQQRMTTLFLMLCAIRDRLGQLKDAVPKSLQPQIEASSMDDFGNERHRYRLDLQYEDSGGVLVNIAKQVKLAGRRDVTKSVENIRNAYDAVMGFLVDEFGDRVNEIRSFYAYLSNKVKLIRIQTEDVAKALKIFETINDRGVGLDSMDLLKNLLFMKADRPSFEKLKEIWKRLQDTIHDAGEKPLRFLRYFIFSRYDVDLLREDQIYGWLSKHPVDCGYDKDPISFANELLAASTAYSRFLAGNDEQNRKRPSLESLNVLAGTASRQQLILLLAGRHLDAPLFDRLVREVENLMFIYAVTREHTRTFERTFARWAKNLRAVTNSEQLDAFITKEIVPVKQGLADRFGDAMQRMEYTSLQKYRLRYLLAKLTQLIETEAYGETEGTRWLSRYTSNEYEIEHVFPTDPTPECREEFGSCLRPDIAQRLGNLTLIEKSINSSLSNRPYSQKCGVYRQSKLLLTQAIAEQPKVGTNTKIDRAVKDLLPFETWNEDAIDARQKLLACVARHVWQV
jgi:hypothetical protein